MQHKCKVTVIDKKLFPDLQEKYLADPKSGACPFYNVGDEFVFTRYGKKDDFWTEQNGKHCAEAWDCISRYIYTALQGGAIMRGWTNDEKVMIACCNDGTRPVIFKIERLDYKAVHVSGTNEGNAEKIKAALSAIKNMREVNYVAEENFFEVFFDKDLPDAEIYSALKGYNITVID